MADSQPEKRWVAGYMETIARHSKKAVSNAGWVPLTHI